MRGPCVVRPCSLPFRSRLRALPRPHGSRHPAGKRAWDGGRRRSPSRSPPRAAEPPTTGTSVTAAPPTVSPRRTRTARAGQGRVRIWKSRKLRVSRTYAHDARIALDTAKIAAYRVEVASIPSPGFARAGRVFSTRLFLPTLRPGAAGPTVARLVSALGSLHYAIRRSSSFGAELVDSLYAFQKVQGLPRTGVADAATWRALANPRLARPRYSSPADHLEVDKGHQVLYVVRGGRVALIVPVSTAGIPGYFTPVGRFAIYRKVGGFDP